MINLLTSLRPAARHVLAALLLTVCALMALPQPAMAGAGSDRLNPDETLAAGAAIASAAGTLRMQGDGNLVLYANQNVPLWASNTNAPGAYAVMQGDGNLVIYQQRGSDRTAVWSSGTAGRGRSSLVMQSDGNLVIYGSGGATWSSNTYRQAYAVNRFGHYGWGADQWPCLNELWKRESGWNERIKNLSSGAYGIPQALPATKMAAAGPDYLTNPFTQIRWGEDYISGRYTNPCRAWDLWQRRRPHWY
jgi:Transglycosylase SLT domain